MLLRNYVIKKLLFTTITIAGALAIIFCGVGMSEIVHSAAGGTLGKSVILKSLLLQLPMLISLLLPLAVFMAGILVISDFIASSELLVMQASGVSMQNINNWVLAIATAVAIIVGFSSLYLEAKADKLKKEMLNTVSFSDVLSGLRPGSFYPILHTGGTLHVSDDNYLFIVLSGKIMTAKKSYSSINNESSSWELKDLKYYEVVPGSSEAIVLEAEEGFVKLNEQESEYSSHDVKQMSFTSLVKNATKPKVASILYWKLSLPLSVLVLALVVVPVTTNNSILQKHIKIIAGIMIYGLYVAFTLALRRYVAVGGISYYMALLGSLSLWLGMLCVYYKWPRRCS